MKKNRRSFPRGQNPGRFDLLSKFWYDPDIPDRLDSLPDAGRQNRPVNIARTILFVLGFI